MKRIAIIAMLLAVLMLAGCDTMGKVDAGQIADAEVDNCMFMVVSNELNGKVLVDKATGVMYWMTIHTNNCGNLTMLFNADWTPRIWEGNGWLIARLTPCTSGSESVGARHVKSATTSSAVSGTTSTITSANCTE